MHACIRLTCCTATRCLDGRATHDITQEPSPVVDGASIIKVSAWQGGIKLAHADSPEQAVVRYDDLAPVILGAHIVVIACGTEGWGAHADTKLSKLRLHCPTEAWARVAAPKVVVTVLAADGARLTWLSHASALIPVAAAHTPQHHARSILPRFRLTRSIKG
jgi:hypothetical protein